MKCTIRLLVVPAATMLLLASCGANDEAVPAEGTAAQEASQVEDEAFDVEQADESESWPIVEDEDGSVVDPDDQLLNDGGDEAGQGNVTSLEFGDENFEIDMDALTAGVYPSTGSYFLEGSTGVQAIAEIGAEAPSELEAMRESLGADPVTYVRFDVDNRNGTEEIGMYELTMYDAAGEEYRFSPITD
ncbi:hypothetical protein, partial [Brachybacterium alimentarium]